MTQPRVKPPCGHDSPQPNSGCRWCRMALFRDRRYARRWWGIEPALPISVPPTTMVVTAAPPVTRVPPEPSGTRFSPTEPVTKLKWSYGVTTVPSRRVDLLPLTLESLRAGGFVRPHLFVDGSSADGEDDWAQKFGLPVTVRNPPVLTAGNWVLALHELYLRNPWADRYAVFQDDLITYRNLRAYLEEAPFPEKGYLNLYTFPPQRHGQKQYQNPPPNRAIAGWYPSNQLGKGAVALVFSQEGVISLLTSRRLVERAQSYSRRGEYTGSRKIDGGIVCSLKESNIIEYVHHPSLVQHMGLMSSMGNNTHPQAETFRGESFDALELIKEWQK